MMVDVPKQVVISFDSFLKPIVQHLGDFLIKLYLYNNNKKNCNYNQCADYKSLRPCLKESSHTIMCERSH